jgi:GntR family transcriptional repressor for pyruvate dehydrogenase complex
MTSEAVPIFRRRPRALSAELTAHLERLITSGHFPPGTPLPSERKLSDSLGVSRTSLREALSELETKRLIERHQGRHSIVTGFYRDAGDVHAHLAELPVSLEHAIEVENLFEPQLARLAAQHATKADVMQLEAVLSASHEHLPPEQSMQLDIEFHLVLARMCNNPLVLGVSQLGAERTVEARIRAHASRQSRRVCIAGHAEICEAVAAKDLDGVEHAMRRHLADVHRFMLG